MKQLITRLTLESPKYFKVMKNRALWVLGSAAALYLTHQTGAINLQTFKIGSKSLLSIVKHLAEISAVVAIVAKTTVKPQVPNSELPKQ